jgi:hypothetical protein
VLPAAQICEIEGGRAGVEVAYLAANADPLQHRDIYAAAVLKRAASQVPRRWVHRAADGCGALLIQRIAAANRAVGLEAALGVEFHANARGEIQAGEVAREKRRSAHLPLRVREEVQLARNRDRVVAPEAIPVVHLQRLAAGSAHVDCSLQVVRRATQREREFVLLCPRRRGQSE